jgi:hypothetical protein
VKEIKNSILITLPSLLAGIQAFAFALEEYF